MSIPETDIDERLWEEYLSWCRANTTHPSFKDFLIWKSDRDVDEPIYEELFGV